MLPSKQALSDLLGIVYDAADNPSLWAAFTEQLARRTKSTSAALLVQVFDQGLYSLSNSWRLPERFVREYQEHYHNLDVWADVVFLKKPSGYVCTSQSLCPLPKLKRTEFYNNSLALGNIEHGMFALAENSNSCLASVCLYRDKSCTEFTDSELQILKFIAPHLKRAFKLHLQFSELRAHSTSMETALDMAPTGVILVGPKREIVLMNRSARVVTAEHDGLLATRFGLQAERPMESAALSRAIQQAARTSEGKGFSAGSTVLVSRRTRPPLEIKVSPVHGSDASPFQKAVVIVFVKDPQKRERAVEGSLRVLHRLSPAECRVALLLGDGHAPRQIANIVGVTDNTVRSQIKSIYSKTGVRRQGELIRLLLGNISPAI